MKYIADGHHSPLTVEAWRSLTLEIAESWDDCDPIQFNMIDSRANRALLDEINLAIRKAMRAGMHIVVPAHGLHLNSGRHKVTAYVHEHVHSDDGGGGCEGTGYSTFAECEVRPGAPIRL